MPFLIKMAIMFVWWPLTQETLPANLLITVMANIFEYNQEGEKNKSTLLSAGHCKQTEGAQLLTSFDTHVGI